VYLAGGFKSNWQADVVSIYSKFEWINPRDKEFVLGDRVVMNVNEYGKWDLHFIRQSDIVFVYVEKSNTSCIGLSCEAGYAKGLGKTVISVIEPNHETIKDEYLSFITQVSDIVFNDLKNGISYLKSFDI
jgi:nucleoside 2-deoxyribosyltransferase